MNAERVMFALFAVSAAFFVVVIVYSAATEPSSEAHSAEAARSARAWADRIGLRVTGVTCVRGWCTVGVEGGAPIAVHCAGGACTVESCK